MRFAPVISVSVSLTVFAWRVTQAAREDDAGWGLFARGPVLFAVLAAVVLCTVLVAFRRSRRAPPRHRASVAFASAVAVALLAATPINVDYDDGCNAHWTVSPAVAAPFIALTRPEATVAYYTDRTTLRACSHKPLPPGVLPLSMVAVAQR
jgi:hypothetical protein